PPARLPPQQRGFQSKCAAGGATGCGQSAHPSWLFLRRILAHANKLRSRGLLELEAIGRNILVEHQLGDPQVQTVIIVRPDNLYHPRERGNTWWRSRVLLLVGHKRLPVGEARVGLQYAPGAKLLQPRDLQISAVKPDLAQNFRAISPTQDG